MAHSTANPQAPEQLALPTSSEPSLQFRLDQRTRQRGLAHIAAIKAQLAARAGERQIEGTTHVTTRQPAVRRAA